MPTPTGKVILTIGNLELASYSNYRMVPYHGWESRKQKSVAISSTEAEYMALTEATREAVYLRRFLNKFDIVAEDRATKIYCDNQSAAKLVQNPLFHGRTKHIDVRHRS